MINPMENSMIPDFSKDEKFIVYKRKVIKDFKNIKEYFPLLKLTCLITSIPKEIYIYGNLIPYEVLKKCKSKKDIERNSLYVLGTYPSDFPKDNLYVEDFNKKIDWSDLPEHRRHRNVHPQTKREILCTHYPNGEINDYKVNDRNIVILSSAWKLYIQYKEYLKTGDWVLKDLPHDYGIKKVNLSPTP